MIRRLVAGNVNYSDDGPWGRWLFDPWHYRADPHLNSLLLIVITVLIRAGACARCNWARLDRNDLRHY